MDTAYGAPDPLPKQRFVNGVLGLGLEAGSLPTTVYREPQHYYGAASSYLDQPLKPIRALKHKYIRTAMLHVAVHHLGIFWIREKSAFNCSDVQQVAMYINIARVNEGGIRTV